MKILAVPLVLALAVSGCTIESDEDRMESEVRNTLSGQGNVTDVQLTREGDNVTGFAELQHAQFGQVRLNCTGRVDGSRFNVNCLPAVTDQVVQNIENNIRERLAQQAEVLEVDLTRRDDMNMAGFARLRGPGGEEVRTDCTATRDNPNSMNFNWRCGSGGPGGSDGK